MNYNNLREIKPLMLDYFDEEHLNQTRNFCNRYYFFKLKHSGKRNRLRSGNKELVYFSSKKSCCFFVTQIDFLHSNFLDKLEKDTLYFVKAQNKYNGQIIGFVYEIKKSFRLDGSIKIYFRFRKKFYKEIIKPRGIVRRKPFKRKKNYIQRMIKKRQHLRKNGEIL
jgi:hypothetical protein